MLKDNEICCEGMRVLVKSVNDIKYARLDGHVYYNEVRRSYNLPADTKGGFYELFFCPWCGAKLPEVLDPDYTICAEYGQDYVRYSFEPEYKELPPELKKEFESDEWWKKRHIGPDENGL